ncbi:MAG: ribonuclease HI family protein [Candidatus Dormibacteraeota bacterium]|nr:ribonuclease HI family protein [Candidatus Dormibacteraeota bacterium]
MRLRTDGASRGNPGLAAIGVVIEDDQGNRLRTFHRFIGTATNNEAEYQALIDGLKAVADWKPDRLEVYLDSKLVVEQLAGKYKVKKPHLERLHRQAAEFLKQFPDVSIDHVERDSNRGADKLANLALDAQVKKATPHG